VFQTLLNWDKEWFLKIHNQWHNGYFDAITPLLRDTLFWIPLFFGLLLFAGQKLGWKVIFFVLLAIASVSLSDWFSSQFFKNVVMRLRPCNDPDLQVYIRNIIKRFPVSFSFTSSHAANHFSIMSFMVLYLKSYWGKMAYALYFFPVIVCYSQVYTGVHYPLDIMGGTIIGFVIGYTLHKVLKKYVLHNELGWRFLGSPSSS
jgi:membrane-associated phospholipid phosphatase